MIYCKLYNLKILFVFVYILFYFQKIFSWLLYAFGDMRMYFPFSMLNIIHFVSKTTWSGACNDFTMKHFVYAYASHQLRVIKLLYELWLHFCSSFLFFLMSFLRWIIYHAIHNFLKTIFFTFPTLSWYICSYSTRHIFFRHRIWFTSWHTKVFSQ